MLEIAAETFDGESGPDWVIVRLIQTKREAVVGGCTDELIHAAGMVVP